MNADQPVSDDQYNLINTMMDQWPGQVSLTPHLFAVFCRQSKPSSKADCEKKLQAMDKCMLSSQNSACAQMWTEYADFVSSLQPASEWSQNEKDARMKAVLDRAIECVGHTRLDSAGLWLKYIDFETTRNNMALVNLLCYMAL